MSNEDHVELAHDPVVRPPPAALDTDFAPLARGHTHLTETPLPLNSRRLTGSYLRSIARAIGLLVAGPANELRVMIEGKLSEMERDPRNVQVIVAKDPHGQDLETLTAWLSTAGLLKTLARAVLVTETVKAEVNLKGRSPTW